MQTQLTVLFATRLTTTLYTSNTTMRYNIIRKGEYYYCQREGKRRGDKYIMLNVVEHGVLIRFGAAVLPFRSLEKLNTSLSFFLCTTHIDIYYDDIGFLSFLILLV